MRRFQGEKRETERIEFTPSRKKVSTSRIDQETSLSHNTAQRIRPVMLATSKEGQTQLAFLIVYTLVHVTFMSPSVVTGFSWHATGNGRSFQYQSQTGSNTVCVFSSLKDNEQQTAILQEEEEDETPAGIGGAEFFGGNKQKEELYDPVAELEAGKDIKLQATSYNRFSAPTDNSFESIEVASMAQSLQRQINEVLYMDNKKLKRIVERNKEDAENDDLEDVDFGRSLAWETPMTVTSLNPMEELKVAKVFYEEIDLAIVGGKKISEDVVELFWELSLVWPTFWSPRVVLAGTSTCTLFKDTMTITKQVDRLFGADNNVSLLSLLGNQITPRFWDWYHIGMTPSAEQVPRQTVAKKGGVTVYQIPPQLVVAPTIVETGTRENRHAQMVPNHAFTCIVRTMGAKKNSYVPTTPVEVQIGRNNKGDNNDDRLLLSWSIPLSTQFQAVNENLRLPVEENSEDVEGSFPTCDYNWLPLRQVATTKYGGNVQDTEISDLRKKLYEQVIKEGWKPKLDQNGKPKFFFWQNDVKACYIEDGLGMCVYEWRPTFADSNEVGIELMVD